MSKIINITMKYNKSTKGTHVFAEIDEDGVIMESRDASIPSLYIRKTALAELAQKIKVTVEIIE